ncbi:MAG TPA: hypothetical protein VKO45_09075 [Methanomicrobiales archaeon]|nr:hypothetical protein [Methanomicrobiales archaeon]
MFICEPCCRERYKVLEDILVRAPAYVGTCKVCKKDERMCLDLNPGCMIPKPYEPEPEQPAKKKAGKGKA